MSRILQEQCNAMTPKYLLKITEWTEPLFDGQPSEPFVSWQPCMDEAEADAYIQGAERPGFGKKVTRIQYEKYMIGAVPRGTIEADPITLLEGALEFHTVDGQRRVNVKLYGQYHDGPSVFWDSRENSFAIVKPSEEQEEDGRFVSDQGVLLVCINGIGEVRWTVDRLCAGYDEHKEAVSHFKLTWGN